MVTTEAVDFFCFYWGIYFLGVSWFKSGVCVDGLEFVVFLFSVAVKTAQKKSTYSEAGLLVACAVKRGLHQTPLLHDLV